MRFRNDSRKQLTIAVFAEGASDPLHRFILDPHYTTSRAVSGSADGYQIIVGGGTLYSGESKEFTYGDLRAMRQKLETALLKVRSSEARESIEDVIDKIGY